MTYHHHQVPFNSKDFGPTVELNGLEIICLHLNLVDCFTDKQEGYPQLDVSNLDHEKFFNQILSCLQCDKARLWYCQILE
jgi:hypothetical protein